MNKIKVGSVQIEGFTGLDSLRQQIDDAEKKLREKGAKTFSTNYDQRDWSDNDRLYIDGYREPTEEEIASYNRNKEQAHKLEIESLNRRLAVLKNT